MHPKEFKHEKAGTGRLTNLCLADSEIHMGLNFDTDEAVQELIADPANFQIISVPFAPDYYSADYRLSELQTFTFGMTAAIELHESISLVLGYKRYLMEGLDGRTAQNVYPDANIFTIGLNGRF